MPLVSIILPTYNSASYLPQSVGSVISQTLGDWELIVADDGSTDDTLRVIQSMSEPRIRVLPLSHVGHPEAVRNRALKEAVGEYVAFIDSDDWWEPEKLERQMAAIAATGASWSFTGFRECDDAGAELVRMENDLAAGSSVVEAILTGEVCLLTPAVVVKRSLIERLGGFDESLPLASDLDLWVRLAQAGQGIAVPGVLFNRRKHPGSYTLTQRARPEAIEKVFTKLASHLTDRRLRKLLVRRRVRWLTGLARQRRSSGRPGALSALANALPAGLFDLDWYLAALRIFIR